MTSRLLFWRGTEPARMEAAAVTLAGAHLTAHGTSLTAAYAADYRLTTGPGWVSRELDVRIRGDGFERSLVLRRSEAGLWTAVWSGDSPQPTLDAELTDAVDCDLGLCPLTNTLPVLRHDLIGAAHRGQSARFDLVMAWVSVPDLSVHRSEQRYTVGDPVEPGGALVGFASEDFHTTIEVDADGLVVNYPGLARRL